MTRFITTARSLFTLPKIVKPVTDITLRQENPKNEIDNPNKQKIPTGSNTPMNTNRTHVSYLASTPSTYP
jgi:hypothetical protein